MPLQRDDSPLRLLPDVQIPWFRSLYGSLKELFRLPKPSLRQFTPPVVVVNNANPKLAMDPSLIIPPDVPLPQVNLPDYGDPLAKTGPP